MMNGVEILASTEVVVDSAFNTTAFWISISIGCIITAIICAWVWAHEGFSFDVIGIAITCMFVSFIIGLVAGAVSSTPIAYATEYKVVISDEVSMNEFLDKYEIIDKEDKIITIREIKQ